MTSIDPTKMDADLLREIAKNVEAATPGFPAEYQGKLSTWARRLNALLPDPAPRTLAELIEDGHAPEEYQWMQADLQDSITGRTTRVVITRADQNVADVVLPSGTVSCIYSDKLTPLPESPRMVWPTEINLKPAEEIPNDSTEPQAGEAWLVSTREGEQREALKAGNRWYVKDGDDVEEWVEEALIPIARLAPEVDPKVLTTEENYRDAPRDTVVKDTTYPFSDVWDKWYENEWRTTTRHGSSKGHTNAEMADTARQVIWAPEVQA